MKQASSLEHALWIGGPPGAGKSSVASRLARRHGLRWYSTDTRTWEHRDRALAAGNAAARRWEELSPDDRWVVPSPEEMLEMSLHNERGAMVIDDVGALPRSPLVVAEGSPIPARMLSTGLVDSSRAAGLVPTTEFHEQALYERALPPGPTELHRLLHMTIEREAREHAARVVHVDGSLDLSGTVDAVEELFGDALAAGPVAESVGERRALLREANHAIAKQVRGFYARPWADGDPEAVVREFVCECGDRSCEANVALPLKALASGAVLAPDH